MHITSSFARPKPCHLLRESYWEDGRVKKRTLANLSALPQPVIDLLRRALRNELPAANPQTAPVRVRTPRQHGAVSAVLALALNLDLERLLFYKPCPDRSRALAMIVCRLLKHGSPLHVARELGPSGQTTLAALLDLRDTPAEDLFDTLDWLADRQPQIERNLAKRHLKAGRLALFGISSSHVEGYRCAPGERGHGPDHPQTVCGVLCTPDGCPISVQSLADSDTLSSQVARLRERFGLQRLALVGDHGMLSRIDIAEDLTAVGCDWITTVRSETIRKLADRQVIRPDLFGTGDASVTAPDFPGERLLIRYNPLEAAEHSWQGVELLEATAAEARLDGLCVIRTSLPREELEDEGVIATYKKLAHAERSLPSLRTTAPDVRSKSPWTEKRVRGHVFLSMLADYVEWHLRRRWVPLLCAAESEELRPQGAVGSTEHGASATEQTSDEVPPVHSLPELLGNLGALTAVELEYAQVPGYVVPTLSELTPLQQRAFELLEAEPHPAPSRSGPPDSGE